MKKKKNIVKKILLQFILIFIQDYLFFSWIFKTLKIDKILKIYMKYENSLNTTNQNHLGNAIMELIIILNQGSESLPSEEFDKKFSWVSKSKKEIKGLILEKSSSNFGIIAMYDLQEYTLKSNGWKEIFKNVEKSNGKIIFMRPFGAQIFDSEGYAFHTLKNYWANDFQSLSTPDNKLKKNSKNQINIRIR